MAAFGGLGRCPEDLVHSAIIPEPTADATGPAPLDER
jgi:hypothetical protein